MPTNVLGTEDAAVNNTKTFPIFMERTEKGDKQANKYY